VIEALSEALSQGELVGGGAQRSAGFERLFEAGSMVQMPEVEA
jgi:hypothetical protein